MDHSINVISDYVCEYYGVSNDELRSKNRRGELVKARNMVLLLAGLGRDKLVADAIGRDRSTIPTNRRNFAGNMQYDRRLKKEYEILKKDLFKYEYMNGNACLSYYSAPGIWLGERRKETIWACVAKIFGVTEEALTDKNRTLNEVLARHLYRHILDRMLIDDTLASDNIKRPYNTKIKGRMFKYSLHEIGFITNCDHSNVVASVKASRNMIQTDKSYRDKAQMVIDKYRANLLTI